MRVLLFLLPATVVLAQTPAVSPGGVVDAATFSAPVVPGSLVSIFGSNLASQAASAGTAPLPLTLGGASVTFNAIPAPLLYVSPTQINAQLPWEVPAKGPVSVVVTSNNASSTLQSVAVGEFSPGLFAVAGHPIAINPDGSVAAPAGSIPGVATYPATPGDTLILLASGLGNVSPTGITGNNSLDALRNTTTAPHVLIGGSPVPVTFAGLSPQFVGVYQINIVMPADTGPAAAAALEIEAGSITSTTPTTIAIGAGWPQWAQNPQHTSTIGVAGQTPARILANIVYDPLVPQEQAANYNELVVHYQVPLIDGNDVYMEFKSGAYSPASYATQTWGENKFSWRNGSLVQQWSYASDWKAPGSSSDFWEPVFHSALANDSVYLPGASGSIIRLNKGDGSVIQRIVPFGADPDTYETGPITADIHGNLFYNAIRIVVDPVRGFYANDAIDSWLVKVAPDGSTAVASYKTLTSAEAPAANGQCVTSFDPSQLPWPPGPAAVPPASLCGTQRVALNLAPAIAADGTIYSATRAQFNDRYAFLVAVNSDLSKKWVASLRNRFNDGCGVPVSAGGWLPANGAPGGCSFGAPLGVSPATNQPGDGRVIDNASSSPLVAPDRTVLLGVYTRYNYDQGHLMHFDADGNYLGAFGFGWDTTPAIYSDDGTWSIVTKNNHYGDIGSYCDDAAACPPDRTGTNPASPEQYFITQMDPNLNIEWNFLNSNTESCTRNSDGSLSCVSDHPNGFEWCVNSPVVDAAGTVYSNSEDGSLYAIPQGGGAARRLFQQLSLGAAYTPASLGGDGKIYSQNDGHLFVAGN